MSRGSRNEMKMGYTKAKKSSLVSGNWLGGNFFSLTRPHIYVFYSKKQTNKQKQESNKAKETKKEKRISPENRLKRK